MTADATAQAALASLLRRSALVELARAAAAYQPTSYDDAVAVRDSLVSLIEQEMDDAGETGDDATYSALLALMTAIVQDLSARGADLSPLVTVTTPQPLTALALANRLYADTTRADQLVASAKPSHPLFMPISFLALAS